MDRPLADQLRPKTLEEIVGQRHLLSSGGIVARSVARKKPLSAILWGPPGCGKTTLARNWAKALNSDFFSLSGVQSSAAEIKTIFSELRARPIFHSRPILFVDEIHRYTRVQQDLFLQPLERGDCALIGATTENPSFAIHGALLSRVEVLPLYSLSAEELDQLIDRAVALLGGQLPPCDSELRAWLRAAAAGDGRALLNMVEKLTLASPGEMLTSEQAEQLLQRMVPYHSRDGEEHYNLISALHKSIRGSDPDAALYWTARMLNAGDDPLYLIRRLIRVAAEDIGLADPRALEQAIAVHKGYEMLGAPEGHLLISQLVVYLSLAPKSNAVYVAHKAAKDSAEQSHHLPPPRHILNGVTSVMRTLGYGVGYQYDHDSPDCFSGQNYFPEKMRRGNFYHPTEEGRERRLQERCAQLEQLRSRRSSQRKDGAEV